MMDSSIFNSILAGVITLAVCMINNYVTLKKERIASEEIVQEEINAIKLQLNAHMADVTARLEEIIANQEISQGSIKKDLEHYLYCINELGVKVDKHNNVIERTYALEKAVEVHHEKISVANHRLDDLERQNEKKA